MQHIDMVQTSSADSPSNEPKIDRRVTNKIADNHQRLQMEVATKIRPIIRLSSCLSIQQENELRFRVLPSW